MEDLYAEDMRYFQTSHTSPDTWMDRTKKVVSDLGGQIIGEAFGQDNRTGHSVYMLAFEIEGQSFKVVWPVLPSRTGKERAARI